MVIVQMWPQPDGSRNGISFDGRTYSSTPGVSIPVQDFDVPVLQANGWTTYSTIAGKTTVTMLPPADGVHTPISFDGRQYSTTPGLSIEVQPFDALILQANGWQLVQLTTVTLQTLTLSSASFHVGDPQGTVVGTIQNASSGSAISFNSLSVAGALQIARNVIQVGPTPSGSPGTVTFNLVETLTGATNTPNQTKGFSVSELVAIPANTVIPTIIGTAQVGRTLTSSNGTWTKTPTSFSYQWYGAGVAISGATAATYIPVTVDIGNTLTVWVTAINAGGSSTPATSAVTSAVIPAGAIPVNTMLPVISGTAQVGQTITAVNGTWTNSPTSYTYEWNRAGTPVSGATTSTYVPVSADVGNTLTISVTAVNGAGSSSPATSSATSSVIDLIPTNTVLPGISGTAQVGQILIASTGTWTHNPASYAYQWNSSAGGAISGATANTYVPVTGDIGNTLAVSVIANNSAGSSTAATSSATSSVIDIIPTNTVVPTISGTAQVGQTLTATTGAWTHSPTSYAYQWTDSSTGAISEATASTYVPVIGNLNHTLTVSVVATNSGGSSSAATSAATSSATTVLSTLTLSANSFTVGAAQATVIGAVVGTTSGSALSLTNSDSGAVQLVSGVIQVGATPPGSSGTFNIQVTETLAGAANSPNATTLSITENASGSGPTLIGNLNMTLGTLPLAA